MGRSIRVPTVIPTRQCKIEIPEPPDTPPIFHSSPSMSPVIPKKICKRLTPVMMNKKGYIFMSKGNMTAQRTVSDKKRDNLGSNPFKFDSYKRKASGDSSANLKTSVIISGKKNMPQTLGKTYQSHQPEDVETLKGMVFGRPKVATVSNFDFNIPLESSIRYVDSTLWARKDEKYAS